VGREFFRGFLGVKEIVIALKVGDPSGAFRAKIRVFNINHLFCQVYDGFFQIFLCETFSAVSTKHLLLPLLLLKIIMSFTFFYKSVILNIESFILKKKL